MDNIKKCLNCGAPFDITKEPPYVCPVCGYVSSNEYYLMLEAEKQKKEESAKNE